MKTKILATAILISFYLFSSFSQAQWEWQNPLPQGNSLYDVEFIDENTGWAVGYHGTLLSTNNGGENWEIHTIGTKKSLKSINIIDDNKAWIIGDKGLILHSSNGGLNWMEQNSGTLQNLNECCFIDSNIGWAVGDSGVILKTINGGLGWEIQNSFTDVNLTSVHFIDPIHGWITGASFGVSPPVILHSNDGGTSWTQQIQLSEDLAMLQSIHFADTLRGWAAGSYPGYNGLCWGIMLHTSDGGDSWEWQDPNSSMLSSVYFQDSLNGWAIGAHSDYVSISSGFIIITDNGGENWVHSESYTEEGLNAFCFVDENNGFFVGQNGIICVTNDSGNNLAEQSSAISRNPLNSIFFTNETTGWIAGAYHSGTSWGSSSIVLKSIDAGQSWDVINDTLGIDKPNIIFIDENVGWIQGVGYYPGGIYSRIYKTMDGGTAWELQYHDFVNINSIWFTNQNDGWAVGDSDDSNDIGIILNTTNGGEDWNTQLSDTSNSFYSVFFSDNNIGWVTGANGIILNTQNGGITWEEYESGTNIDLLEVVFTDPDNGWIVGSKQYYDADSSIILHTTNVGETWEESHSGEDWGLSDIHFTDMYNGWAVGDHIVLYTQNGGNSWEVYDELPTDQLSGIWFTNPDNGWLVGNGGRILFTSDGGLTEIPKKKISISNLKLESYPNPFSEYTTISYKLSEKSWVFIEIYNSNGQLVFTQNNEFKQEGQYEMIFDSQDLPSGVYFLSLKINPGYPGCAGQTIKMIKL